MVDKTVFIGSILRNFPNLRTYFYTFELNNNLEYGKFERSRNSTLEDYCGGDEVLIEKLVRILNYYISRSQE